MLKPKNKLRNKAIKEIRRIYKEIIYAWNGSIETVDVYNQGMIDITRKLHLLNLKKYRIKVYFGEDFEYWFFEGHNKQMLEILNRKENLCNTDT